MKKGPAPIDPALRFWPKVHKTPSCWIWLGGTNGKYRYGVFFDGRKHVYAHRWSYEHFVGPIPEGLQLDHLCREQRCVRPDHLEPVTNRENHRRGSKAQQTHCIHGHEFTPENTYVKSNGTRACRACSYERDVKRGRHQPQAPITHCIRGHEFTPENTKIRKNGTRLCRACRPLYPSKVARRA